MQIRRRLPSSELQIHPPFFEDLIALVVEENLQLKRINIQEAKEFRRIMQNRVQIQRQLKLRRPRSI